MLRFKILILLILFCLAGVAAGDAPAQEARPHGVMTCDENPQPKLIIDNAALAFTGRVIRQKHGLTWFRIYLVHHGEPPGWIVAARGFPGNKDSIAGNRSLYKMGDIYTVVLNIPENESERHYGEKPDYFINALDPCQERVLAKIHERYGLYYVAAAELIPEPYESMKNHIYFHHRVYSLLWFAITATGISGAFLLRGPKHKRDARKKNKKDESGTEELPDAGDQA